MRTLFNQALDVIANCLIDLQLNKDPRVLLLRDMQGRMRVAIDGDPEWLGAKFETLRDAFNGIGTYGEAKTGPILFRKDFFNPSIVFSSNSILEIQDEEWRDSVRILDRTIVGQDWLMPGPSQARCPRLVFYGFKGGVGRSTALAVLAHSLALSGKKILLLDLDLESPGLSSMLLPQDQVSEFGIVDWLIEEAVGQEQEILPRMVAVSPISFNTPGEIRVVPAAGGFERAYLAKLSRIYSESSKGSNTESFSQRIQCLLDAIETQEHPDIILIDSRAGLHDLAAISIVSLATNAFLFASDTQQSWSGYRLLFQHWQRHPRVLQFIREKIAIVQALFPEKEQLASASRFLQNSHDLFSTTIYEKEDPGNSIPGIFNYSLNDDSAPHFPVRINWDGRFQEFNTLLLDKGILTSEQILATFGSFIKKAKELAGLEGEDE